MKNNNKENNEDESTSSISKQPNVGTTQTIEKTSKRYKLQLLVGFSIFGISFMLAIISSTYDTTLPYIFLFFAFVGLIIVGVGKLLAWWHHG